jgi:hypothetical protein
MKKTIWLLSTLLILFLSTCSKDKEITDQTGVPDLKSAHSSGAVFTVNPNGSDDTQALIDAFEDAKAAGPGSEVKLVQGEYHIGLIEVHDFIGSFTGAGMGKSVIFPLPDLPCSDVFNQNLSTGLIKFFGGNFKVSQMSFRNPGGNPCHCEDCANPTFANVLWYFLGFLDYSIIGPIPPDHYIKAAVDNVEFTGTTGGPFGYDVFMATMCSGDFGYAPDLPYSNADLSITNCSFNNFYYVFQNLGIGSGSFIFKNNKVLNTLFAIWLQDNIGGNSFISGNKFNVSPGGTGIGINNSAWGFNEFRLSDGCQYEISDNEFITESAWTAIDVCDGRKLFQGISDNKNSLLLLVKNNLFDLRGTTSTGIWNFYTTDAVIRNNKFTGQATDVAVSNWIAENALFLGNNFSNMTNTAYNILMLGNNNTVIGGNNKGTILNLGENNLITGMNIKEGENPVGQSIIDNYRIMQENMKKMRKP